ncbi:MAG: hypothetical protein IJS90_02700 [Clostridia bacterium]|nr:hypothetical protein [Clostridia bacterium]
MKKIRVIIAILLLFSLLTVCACRSENSGGDVTEESVTETESETVYEQPSSDAPLPSETQSSEVTESVSETEIVSETEAPAPETTAAPETTTLPPETTTAAPDQPTGTDYSSYSKEDIVKYLSDAVNRTKAFTGNVTVHHKESFTSTVTNVTPGGALVTQAVNFVKDLVLKPTEEDYSFSGGKAVTSEGETTQLLLPKAAPFTLTSDGVANATISDQNGLIHVVLTLAPEEVNSLSEVPKYNSSSIGYLDIANAFSIINVQEVNIKYPGSVIDAYVRADGYVKSVTYTIKLDAFSKASAMGITGTANFNGDQVEVWNINWQ